MTTDQALVLLRRVAAGDAAPEDALALLSRSPMEELTVDALDDAFARIDHHRGLRVGFPEVVFCPGKTTDQIVRICQSLAERDGAFLATRADEPVRRALREAFAAAAVNDLGRTIHLDMAPQDEPSGDAPVLIVSAGTADLPVAEEAAVTAAAFHCPIERLYDVGVAGLHRLLERTEALRRAGVIIVVAGMDGALPSVVGGLVSAPVIAVPTSVGYGASLGGLAALLTMLNSCAAGITVVNIDNGFGAACAATRIRQRPARVS